VKHWEIIADNLSKAAWSGAASQPLIVKGGQSGLQTRIATTVGASLCARMESSARFWNWKGRFVSTY
jgi:hypothetical protein